MAYACFAISPWGNVGEQKPFPGPSCWPALLSAIKTSHHVSSSFPLSLSSSHPLTHSLSLSLSLQMAIAVQKSRLRSFIQSIYDEGIVNDQFSQLQSVKEAIRRDYAVRAITRFCVSCINLFSTLTDQIYQQKVYFQKVHVLARELYARASGCFQALYWTKDEFSYLSRKLGTLVQMERRIIDLENMQ